VPLFYSLHIHLYYQTLQFKHDLPTLPGTVTVNCWCKLRCSAVTAMWGNKVKAFQFQHLTNYKVVSEGYMFQSKFACNIRVSKAGLFIMHITGIYIHIYIYIHTHTHTHIYIYIYVYIHTHTYTYAIHGTKSYV